MADDVDNIFEEERHQAAYEFRRSAVGTAWNMASVGALLLLSVWLVSVSWTVTGRALWCANALFTVVNVATIPTKVSLVRSIRADQEDARARRFALGMLATVLIQDGAVVTLVVWTGFRVW